MGYIDRRMRRLIALSKESVIGNGLQQEGRTPTVYGRYARPSRSSPEFCSLTF